MTASAHVLVFRPLIELLRGRGDEVSITARDYAQTLQLLELHGLEAEVIGRHGGRSRFGKARQLTHRLGALPGCSVSTDGDFFDRFALRVPRLATGAEGSGYAMRNALLVDNVLVEATASHYGDRDDLIIQCTEMTTDAEMDALVAAIESIAASVRETVSAR
jgi:hypothetical protein